MLSHRIGGGNVGQEKPTPGVFMYDPTKASLSMGYEGAWGDVYGNKRADLGLGTHWDGVWNKDGPYDAGSMVLDSGYLAICTGPDDCTDRPAPQITGAPAYVYDGASPTGTINAKSLIIRQHYSPITGYAITAYRVYTIPNSEYQIYYTVDGVVTELIAFTGVNTGWQRFELSTVLVPPGKEFAISAVISQPPPIPVTFSGNWDYSTPPNPVAGDPGSGVLEQANDTIDILRASTTDNDGGDRSVEFATLTAGDKIRQGALTWTILAIANQGTYYAFTVTPGQQLALPDGVLSFTFETAVAADIETVIDTDYWLSNSEVSGSYSVDGAAPVLTEDQYGIDIEAAPAILSDQWELMAVFGDQVPDDAPTTLSGTFDVPDTPVSIVFDRPFKRLPRVLAIPNQINGSNYCYVVNIGNVSKQGFEVAFYETGPVARRMAGPISWIARGQDS
jgi:hypothetical protein